MRLSNSSRVVTIVVGALIAGCASYYWYLSNGPPAKTQPKRKKSRFSIPQDSKPTPLQPKTFRKVLVVYSTIKGSTKAFAERLSTSSRFPPAEIVLIDVAAPNAKQEVVDWICLNARQDGLVLFLTNTHIKGSPTSSCLELANYVADMVQSGFDFGVLGFGASKKHAPTFCEASATIRDIFRKTAQNREVVPFAQIDKDKFYEESLKAWERLLAETVDPSGSDLNLTTTDDTAVEDALNQPLVQVLYPKNDPTGKLAAYIVEEVLKERSIPVGVGTLSLCLDDILSCNRDIWLVGSTEGFERKSWALGSNKKGAAPTFRLFEFGGRGRSRMGDMLIDAGASEESTCSHTTAKNCGAEFVDWIDKNVPDSPTDRNLS